MQITFLVDLNYNQLTSIVYNNEYYLVMMLNLDKKKNIIFVIKTSLSYHFDLNLNVLNLLDLKLMVVKNQVHYQIKSTDVKHDIEKATTKKR